MNKAFEIFSTILMGLSLYLLFNLYDELDSLRNRQQYYEKRLESIYDYTFRDYESCVQDSSALDGVAFHIVNPW